MVQRSKPHVPGVSLASGENIKAERRTATVAGISFSPPGKLTNAMFRAPTSNTGNIKLNFGSDADPQFFLIEPGDILPPMQMRDDKVIKARGVGTDQILCVIFWG